LLEALIKIIIALL